MWAVLPCSQLWAWLTHPSSNRVGCIGLPERGASRCCWPEFHHSTGKHTRTTRTCSRGVQRTPYVSSSRTSPTLFETGPLIGLNLPRCPGKLAGDPLSSSGITSACRQTGLLCGFGGLNSGLHSCKASTLWTESFRQPQRTGLSTNIPSGLLASDTLTKSKLNFN